MVLTISKGMDSKTHNVDNSGSITSCLYFFLFGTLIIWYSNYIWGKRKLYNISNQLPGPRALPFIGNIHHLFGDGHDNLNKAMALLTDYNGLMRIWFGPKLLIASDSPEFVKKLLNHPHCINKPYNVLVDALKDGLVTSSGKKWRRHRKIISPSFNQQILDSFVEIFYEKSSSFCKHLKGLCGKRDIDFGHEVSKCTLDSICQTAMGVNLHIQKSNSKFAEAVENALDIMNYRIFRYWYYPKMLWKLSTKSWELEQSVNYLNAVTQNVIRKKLEKHNRVSDDKSILANDVEAKKKLAFLDLLIRDSPFTETELSEEVITFLMGGTETSATAMSFLCVVLGLFPDIQQRVYDEVMDVFGMNGKILPRQLKKLCYTDRVIKEVLRIFPIGPIIARKPSQDLLIGDLVIPKGSVLVIGIANLHRNPKYWPDPLKFNPDRFLPEEVAKRDPCTYIPFSYGMRNCIGARYAILNMKTMLSTFIRQFTFHTEYKSIEDIKLKISVLLRMKDGPKIWLESRQI